MPKTSPPTTTPTWTPLLLNILPSTTEVPIEMPPPKGCACWPAIARQIVLGLFPLRLQLRPFQRQSDPVGACLDGANRSIQFCRDHFGAGVRFRHSSKKVILLWRPPVAAEFNHVTTISPSPLAPISTRRRWHQSGVIDQI